jgi:hypothetical protein
MERPDGRHQAGLNNWCEGRKLQRQILARTVLHASCALLAQMPDIMD